MKIFASVHIFNRPVVLRHCLDSVLKNTVQPDDILLIDDGSDEPARAVMDAVSGRNVTLLHKTRNCGAAHSGRISLARARALNPEYFFIIEADYIFKPWAFATVLDIFEHTEVGAQALGVVGYDHPNAYQPFIRDHIFPECMKAQVGEDNVNRAALYRPAWCAANAVAVELVSNTCPTCYLHWRRVQEVAAEFPKLNDLLDQVMDPRDNPNYPDSGKYQRTRQIDDGMLSHAISLVWNRWAIKHDVDRNRFGAWLNIKPSIANNITGGGVNTPLKEMETDGGSPSWTYQ